ncbi:MAG: hypothetical protein GXY34_05405 [Syntrophomonadaceae bacterium]|nr:hypothetical protein [Syntrophomonadaceae bacterium]
MKRFVFVYDSGDIDGRITKTVEFDDSVDRQYVQICFEEWLAEQCVAYWAEEYPAQAG